MNDARMENEEIRVTVMHKGVVLMATTKRILEQEKTVEFLESDETIMLEPNEKMVQRSCLTRILPSGENRTLLNNVHNWFIGLAVKVKGAIHTWCTKEVSELRQYDHGIERSWKNERDLVVKLGMVRQTRSKIISYSLFWLCLHGT